MFLEYFKALLDIIVYIFNFIEGHSVLVGVVTSVIISSLWMRKFIKQKRAEAFFGYYAQLSLRLKTLQTRLNDDGLLDVTDNTTGNIYSLIYLKDDIRNICPNFKIPDSTQLEDYKRSVSELKTTLINTENNVYPQGADRHKWYESQHVLFSFCEFIEYDENRHKTNIPSLPETKDYRHIILCKSLINAMNYIQQAIDNAKY